jgi:acetoin utilization deacetylase AcuC-like enzyme
LRLVSHARFRRGFCLVVVFHHPDCAGYAMPGHPERPERVVASAAHLARAVHGIEWRKPGCAPESDLLRAHTAEHLARLQESVPFDGDTPYYDGIADFAALAAGAAVAAMEEARAGRPALSLMRPPGHHATADRAMGFCFLNNIAIAALKARAEGTARVAIWDFDAHHGNGTEAIVRGREGILFASVHQFPGYPGTGTISDGNCLNYPVLPDTSPERHMEVLRRSWEAVLSFKPDLVLVSAGFDAYEHDPITTLCLRREDFLTVGCWLHDANCPTAALLEGGYSKDLPILVAGFLEGWLHG